MSSFAHLQPARYAALSSGSANAAVQARKRSYDSGEMSRSRCREGESQWTVDPSTMLCLQEIAEDSAEKCQGASELATVQ